MPFMPSPLEHDYHHQVFNVNYGILDILDTLHNTRADSRNGVGRDAQPA
jgi:sterol desaturase/sphingolipid hydroxylase (fatty acid hydroxylase superfamily)